MNNTEKSGFRCGMVSIVGRPNVGKSTLLNDIIGEKVAIVSQIPQTTRNQIRGIYNDERGQIIFIDTPGLHLGGDQLNRYMNRSSINAMQEVDCVIYLVDTTRRIGAEEKNVADKLKNTPIPIILGLNKVDLKAPYIQDYIAFWEKMKGQPVTEMEKFTMIALSGQNGTNVDKLIDIIYGYLPEGPALYPLDTVSDVPKKMVMADIIREKLFLKLREEIPHSLGVMIEGVQPIRKKTLSIKALILVERPSQKQIVIGKNGKLLKEVGTLAREELEDLLETKVFLELFVKTSEDWRDDPAILEQLGYVPG